MRAEFEFLRVIGNSDSTELVTGESGTRKEVTATLMRIVRIEPVWEQPGSRKIRYPPHSRPLSLPRRTGTTHRGDRPCQSKS
jgi:hypothetical protein